MPKLKSRQLLISYDTERMPHEGSKSVKFESGIAVLDTDDCQGPSGYKGLNWRKYIKRVNIRTAEIHFPYKTNPGYTILQLDLLINTRYPRMALI